ncbi:armadillo repeat-containing protein 6 isoform X2 [Apteryx mantelli]|uniref:Armadillo repeat-containing protein 6 isoform X2 n=1 Tax=Apteryx mantelli TaxID=2696672 RepID=A0ABM4FVL2_9AVES|nr:PREDICTED: armadillo repeat-containing protein 6 isoform X2 [Apteryx mantelli mantelli]
MGSKQIAQETFDDAVQENIMEFEMDPEEAVREAVQQFEAQGVDLSNIVKAVRHPASENGQKQKHEILLTLDSLRRSVADSDLTEMAEQLVLFTEQCKEQLAFRYLAGQHGAYSVVFPAFQLASGDRNLMLKVFYALSAVLDGQPDLLDSVGQDLLLQTLKEYAEDAEMTLAAIRCIRHACLKHEQNRQDLVKGGVLPLLTGAIVQHGDSADVVRMASSALRIMTFDDDIRVPFGHAHDHAKMIVLENDGLRVLIEAAKAFTDNSSVLSELCATLSRLSVRNEFCQEIVDLGGLNFMVSLLADCIDHPICEQGCAALCMLALRKPENCNVIMEGGGALAALQAMKAHPKEVAVQKQACMLIRNLVSRSRDFSQPILEMGAENLITEARATHKDCDDVAKAALRDLGCKVELRELWTGQKGSLAQ